MAQATSSSAAFEETYDYIITGGGSSGCIVAGELSQDPARRVLLLEAGPHADENLETLAANQYKKAFINPALMWERFSQPQAACRKARLFLGSGRGLGGSGAINAMVYTRGAAYDFDSWGLPGWRFSDVEKDFSELESRLSIGRPDKGRFTQTCIAAACQSGFAEKHDFNDGALSGFLGYEWMNLDAEKNERHSSYVRFLRPHERRENLTLRTGAQVRRILTQRSDRGLRATGVEYLHDGKIVIARAKHEVILATGALETPRLLLLSGIGPQDELRRHELPVAIDLPGVGKNLMDHPNVSLFFLGRQPTDCNWAQLYGFHRANPESALPPGEADTCYVFYSARSSFREGMMRMLPTMALPPWLYNKRWPAAVMRSLIAQAFRLGPVRRFVERMYGIVVILGKPQSRGSVSLRSADCEIPAAIDPAYFADPADLTALVRGVELARRVAGSAALADWGNRELIPGGRVKKPSGVERFIKNNVMTTYHYAGTCRMGADDDRLAVTDDRLRVRGIAGLRIADASAIPSVPVSAMNAPSMLLGYRASRFIAEDLRQGSVL